MNNTKIADILETHIDAAEQQAKLSSFNPDEYVPVYLFGDLTVIEIARALSFEGLIMKHRLDGKGKPRICIERGSLLKQLELDLPLES